MVHLSVGMKQPASPQLLSELAIIAGIARAALSDSRSMLKGSKIGVYLTHRYPHTHKVLGKLLPRALKGVDMAVSRAGLRKQRNARSLAAQPASVHVVRQVV